MANTITLKRRISSVKNTRQITKAMELVAASKMRRAQESALHGRAYREAAHELLTKLGQIIEVDQHPLYVKRAVKTRVYVVITSNRGLAGAYNSNIIRMLSRAIIEDQRNHINSQVIAIGKQVANFARRVEGVELLAAYSGFGDHPTANDIRPILNQVVELYTEQKADDIKLLYTTFQSNLVQTPTNLALLPAIFEAGENIDKTINSVTFEPSIEAVLDNVTVRLLEVQLWQAMLESVASEHSMRMMAMKNATDNASDLIDDLTLAFNTARQAAITQELAEITGGAEAIK
ncbi:MAG TPA: ATP synthase F1 subunit gamma [Candidatus Saccharimonadales bacterium]|nr:ATP synthase F1 subunit gamma [Candidatus Saccharimonadales bacterium]